METQRYPSTPTLKRPQNRRDVFHKKSPYIQRAAKLTVEDLDGIFDSYDDDEDLIPPSPVEETHTRAAQRSRGKVLQSAATSNIPDLDIVLNSPFKNRASFKTSSPIDTQRDVQHDMGRISPIPFNVEEEEPERVLQKPTDLMNTFEVEPTFPERIALKKNLAPLMTVAPPQKGNGHLPAVSVVSLVPQKKVPEKKSNGLKDNPAPSKKLVKPNIHTFEVESPPEIRITLKKIPDPLKKVEAPREETGPGASKTLKESEMTAAIRREKPKQKNGDKLVSAPSQEPQPPAQENPSKIPTLSKKVAAPQQENGHPPVMCRQENGHPPVMCRQENGHPPVMCRQETGHPPVMAGRLEKPQNTPQEKLKETPATSKNLAASDKETGPRRKPQDPPVEKSSREENIYTLLQKLKEARQSKPAPPIKVCLPIRAPPPPLEEDEFWIMEPPPRIELCRRKQYRPRQASGEAGADREIPSKERTAAEEQPKERTAAEEQPKDRKIPSKERTAAEEHPKDRKIPSKERTAAEEHPKDHKIPSKERTAAEEHPKDHKIPSKERTAAEEHPKDRKIPSKERTAAEEQPKDRTAAEEQPKEFLEMKKRGPKSKAGKDRPVKDREFIQEPDCAVELQSQEPPGKKHGGQTRVKSTKDARERIQEPDDSVEVQSQEPPGKKHGGQTRVKSTKDARERIQEPDDSVEVQSQEPPGKEHGETLHTETDVSLAEESWNPGGGRKRTSKDVAGGKTKNGRTQNASTPPDRFVAGKRASSPDRVVSGKRQRKPPGEWWLSHGLDTEWNAVEAQDVDSMKMSQRGKIERTQKKQSEPGQKANKKKDAPTKVRKKQHRTTGKTTAALSPQIPNQEDLQQHADHLNDDPVQSKSLVCPLGEDSITTGYCLFNKQDSNVPKTIPDHVESRNIPKNKAVVCEVPENDEITAMIQVQKPNSKKPKIRKKARMQRNPKIQGKILFPVQEEPASLTSNVSECPSVEVVATDITETSAECWPSKDNLFQNSTSAVAFAKVQGFTSGPSSMIALEAYEEQDTSTCLPSFVVRSALSATELCAFPLAPVALQARDEENLTKWFSLCWPAIVKTAPQMNTDAFRWFSYRRRMLGVCEDLLHDNWCVGKMILGSHAQKPLWVDHSATTVYNVLTSAVSVTVDGVVSQYNPGLAFAVPCGHAHSINNLTDEPAVLIFNRQRNHNAD